MILHEQISATHSSGVVGLFNLVFLLIGFRLLITTFHELRRPIKRGFEHAKQLPVYPDQSTVRIAALVVFKQPFMVADIRKEEGGQYGDVRDVDTRGQVQAPVSDM